MSAIAITLPAFNASAQSSDPATSPLPEANALVPAVDSNPQAQAAPVDEANVPQNQSIQPSAGPNPTDITTGLTNNILVDSFVLPFLLIVATTWLYATGRARRFIYWLEAKI